MKAKSFHIPSVGKVIVTKHHNSRRITLKLKPGESPKVTIPALMTYDMGFNFALEKKDWIIKHLKQFEQKKTLQKTYNENTPFSTRHKTILFGKKGSKISVEKSKDSITLFFPTETDIEDKNTQHIIKNFIIEILRSEAKSYLIPRTEELAKQFKFKYNKVYIKNLKSRWGSCSSINNINLNLHLMRLPEHLSDFIILHELCHTIHKNHGENFHALLNTITGNEKLLNKELRKYTIEPLI